MKNLKLSELNLGNEAEVLTREQLKKVLGGAIGSGGTTVPGTTAETCQISITCADGTEISCTGHNGDCHYKSDSSIWSGHHGWVQCDDNDKVKCN